MIETDYHFEATQADPRDEMRKRYHAILKKRDLIITSIKKDSIKHILHTVEQYKNLVTQEDNLEPQSSSYYQTTAVFAIYLGQIFGLLQTVDTTNTLITNLKDTFKDFESFAGTHLSNIAPRHRYALRNYIGKYVLSLVYEPNGTGRDDFVWRPGYWHSTGSHALSGIKKYGLLSPLAIIEMGKTVVTGEYVSGTHQFGNPNYEQALIHNQKVDSDHHDNRIYLDQDRFQPLTTQLSDGHTVNAVTWFDHFPIDIFISRDLLSASGAQISYSPGTTSEKEVAVLGKIPFSAITDVFVPKKFVASQQLSDLEKAGVNIHCREDYGLTTQNTIRVDDTIADAFQTTSE